MNLPEDETRTSRLRKKCTVCVTHSYVRYLNGQVLHVDTTLLYEKMNKKKKRKNLYFINRLKIAEKKILCLCINVNENY